MARPLDLDLRTRLKAMGLDTPTCRILVECRPVIETIIDDAILESYKLILNYPDVQKAYSGIRIEDACASQRKHWLHDVFAGTFDEQQIRNGADLFAKRQRQGLPLRWFFVFYANMLRRFILAVQPHYRRDKDKMQAAIDALTRAVMFEIEVASAAYMHSAQEQVAVALKAAASDFEREVFGVVEEVSGSVQTVSTAAQVMIDAANTSARETSDAAQVASRTSENIGAVASAADQLSASIQEISGQMGQATDITDKAVQEAQRTDQLVQGLAEAVGKIGDVVKLINDIASQTNLLALNATIEAARAGDAGKGFAVVASEVKSLANQTSRATDEISGQIAAVQGATRDAVDAIQGIGGTIGNINAISATVASAVEEQRASTREIGRRVDEAAQGGQQVTATIEQVNALAEKTDGTAQELSMAVGTLSTQTALLSKQVGQFLDRIRSD
ncbi:chemotaxis protein [Roseospira marina]|uniref:Chemotaxis protein n=1 Tax=Roseospira marina TaxID=140057 RepID=A0A5M6IBH5_9PROT|nr:globin-coupled sensor protein [Roseospira marina]KAA5605085.1 chemotaxis protein [Roseospira marina]MBB4314831.1 methyl-accepting chemotaxis protein [Roseospira marina]MBB5087831.1 methyl-accepting chemotaxis protein [Roseospira marina]